MIHRSRNRPLVRSLIAALGTALPWAQAPTHLRAPPRWPVAAITPAALRPGVRGRFAVAQSYRFGPR